MLQHVVHSVTKKESLQNKCSSKKRNQGGRSVSLEQLETVEGRNGEKRSGDGISHTKSSVNTDELPVYVSHIGKSGRVRQTNHRDQASSLSSLHDVDSPLHDRSLRNCPPSRTLAKRVMHDRCPIMTGPVNERLEQDWESFSRHPSGN